MPRFKPKDIVALSVIAALVVFKLTGHNGALDAAAAVIVGYYFAHRADGYDRGD